MAAVSAPHTGQVFGQAELSHLHLPGELAHHDVSQGQVTVHHLEHKLYLSFLISVELYDCMGLPL